MVFVMGVVSGVVMSYQFGTNWSVFADRTGAIVGPLMDYEVLSAFFLEAGFLGVMLFGVQRAGKALHYFSTLMVALGTLFSTFWILSAVSWMQTPVGFAVNEAGQFVPANWWKIIFNPSFPYRLVHMVLAAYLTTAFVVGAVGAWHLLRDNSNAVARLMYSMALWMATLVAPLQLFAGDQHGLNTLAYQPVKVAAMEGHFLTRTGAPLVLFGIPDQSAGVIRHTVELPKLASLILTHSWDGEVRGLRAWPPREWPDVAVVFWSFRLMVGVGLLMIAIGVWSLVCRARRQLFRAKLLQQAMLFMGPSGFIAVLAGWVITEVGRQPFTVYGLLRTSASASPVAAPAVAGSLAVFVAVYFLIFGAGTYYLVRLVRDAPGRSGSGERGVAP